MKARLRNVDLPTQIGVTNGLGGIILFEADMAVSQGTLIGICAAYTDLPDGVIIKIGIVNQGNSRMVGIYDKCEEKQA